jgi:cell division protein FtsI/penicillin-binding protein 2
MAANGHIRHIRCWKPQGHGSLRLRDALAQSCNLFFFNLGREVSPAGFQAHASAAGFTATRLDTWRNPLSPLGDVPSLCISPRTAARWMLQLAQQSTEDAPCPLGQQQLRAGMLASVREGTAKAANVPGLQVAGKTGTATYADGSNRTWGWFVGWAYPLENRRRPLSIALRLPETAGPGKAAGLAGQILRTWKTRGCP